MYKIIVPLTNKLFPENGKKDIRKIELLGKPSLLASTLVVEHAQQENKKLLAMLQTIFELTLDHFLEDENTESYDKLNKYIKITGRVKIEMDEFLNKANQMSLNETQALTISQIQRISYNLEGIAKNCKVLIDYRKLVEADHQEHFSQTNQYMSQSLQLVSEFYEVVFSKIIHGEQQPFEEFEAQSSQLLRDLKKLKQDYVSSFSSDKLSAQNLDTILEVNHHFKAIHQNTMNIVESFFYR